MGFKQSQLLGDQPCVRFQGTGLCGGTRFAGTPLEQGVAQLRLKVANGHAHR